MNDFELKYVKASICADDGDIEPSNFVPQTPSDSDEEVGIPYFPGTSSAKQYAAHDKASSQNLRPAISAASKPAVPSKQETMPGAKGKFNTVTDALHPL